jgi:hypothetical protein
VVVHAGRVSDDPAARVCGLCPGGKSNAPATVSVLPTIRDVLNYSVSAATRLAISVLPMYY